MKITTLTIGLVVDLDSFILRCGGNHVGSPTIFTSKRPGFGQEHADGRVVSVPVVLAHERAGPEIPQLPLGRNEAHTPPDQNKSPSENKNRRSGHVRLP